MRIFLISIWIIVSVSFSWSQELGEEVRNAQRFKIHIVEAGNTLYGLHVKYNASIDDIIKENPSAAEGLKIGQRLYIPVEGAPKKERIHIVQKKETLFGISRQYNCSVDELIKLNPGVEEGLRIGQELKVPGSLPQSIDLNASNTVKDTVIEIADTVKYEVDFSDSLITYTVQKGETLYSISRRFMVPVEKLVADNNIRKHKIKPGEQLKILLKKERIDTVLIREVQQETAVKVDSLIPDFIVKSSYKVAVLLPLRIQENGDVLSGLYDEDTRLDQLTNISMEFLMGVQLALDSLEKLGLNAEVEFYDTRGVENRLGDFFESSSSDDLDLIIGPFYPNLVVKTADWCKINRVRMVAVTKIPTTVLKNNPYVYSVVPSELTLIGAMAKYVANHHDDDNLFMIKSKNEETNDRIAFFKSVYDSHKSEGGSAIREMNIGSADGRELFRAIDEDTTTLFICLEKDVKDIMVFVNALNAAKNYSPRVKNANVYLVGTQEWLDHDAFNSYYRNRFEFHFASANYLNYQDETTKAFVKEFRNHYESDPTRYAIHGFDAMLSQGASLLLGIKRDVGIMDRFNLYTIKKGHGQENMSAFISKQNSYEIKLIKVIGENTYFEEASGGNH